MTNVFLKRVMVSGLLIGMAAASFGSRQAVAQTADTPMFVDLVRATGLSSSQQSDVAGIVAIGNVTLKRDLAALAEANLELSALMSSSGPVVMADVAPLLENKEAIAAQVDHDFASMRLEMRSVLTAEQLARLQDYQQRLSSVNGQKAALIASLKP